MRSRLSGPASGLKYTQWTAATLLGLSACAQDPSLVRGPTANRPQAQMASVEHTVNPGSIFQPGNPNGMVMFQEESKPRRIGDSLKIDISESLSASNKSSTTTSRANKVATKGPGGADTMSSLINQIINADLSASGSDSYQGSGKAENTSKLQGKLAASVVNVLPNGNLVVAGEKSIAMNGSVSTLRFSGVVDPADIKAGRTVSSSDVIDARLEQLGSGQLKDTEGRSGLQRLLTDSLTIW
ncbi:flagellar basal body L-ring protein FlgH [Uliginosibacterium aquaticum]|uniref:Flagellar basal body L-ring protein FlgH n=1 Tax=Uliginosibacterium aquaticum TaxID=2731212 RepID=A0ABX2IIP9_9RHOO|nr:flagellar basal body L-ring protein FlgH [Uliginosibacterium aquaticum]NSL56615.1 flagellar basal body L-ring protein FlgH [Uliginosibacterium aquaticum]